jgi:hypothetical protein
MVCRLAEVIQAKQKEGCSVAAVGPQYLDERNAERASFVRLAGLGKETPRCETPKIWS